MHVFYTLSKNETYLLIILGVSAFIFLAFHLYRMRNFFSPGNKWIQNMNLHKNAYRRDVFTRYGFNGFDSKNRIKKTIINQDLKNSDPLIRQRARLAKEFNNFRAPEPISTTEYLAKRSNESVTAWRRRRDKYHNNSIAKKIRDPAIDPLEDWSDGIPWSEAIKFENSRPKKERIKDEKELSKNLSEYPTKAWLKNPNKSDVQMIDTPDTTPQLREDLLDYYSGNRGNFKWLVYSYEYQVGIDKHKKYVIKVPYLDRNNFTWESHKITPEKDYKILKLLHKHGLAPKTWYLPREQILVQQYIERRDKDITDQELREAKVKIKKLGVQIGDLHHDNILVDKKTGMPYVIDVGFFDDPGNSSYSTTQKARAKNFAGFIPGTTTKTGKVTKELRQKQREYDAIADRQMRKQFEREEEHHNEFFYQQYPDYKHKKK